ncbi:MAG: GGDEF domain-containing protein [Rhodospirillaceae bacterium]|nr:GGDEF domain-containing protein [Rhodospirillaceae bacterium]
MLSLLGISDAELSARARAVLVGLLCELAAAHRELDRVRACAMQLERLADEDTLLPIANRRAFVRELTRMMAFARRYETPGCLLFFDVDNLKRINDGHGHAAGDAGLRHIAELLQANIRSSDILGRLGGDEFGVIMARCDPATAAEKAQWLVELVESRPLAWDGQLIPLSLSVGLCPFSGHEDVTAMLQAADRAMYRQKGREPRGRVPAPA